MTFSVRVTAASVIVAAVFGVEPANAQMRFAVVGDMGNSANAMAVAALINVQRPDHVITTGDNCYGRVPISLQIAPKYGTFVQWRRFWPSLGNHEYTDPCGDNSRAYRSYFDLPNNERYYAVRLGPIHFFAINSTHNEPHGRTAGSEQGQWIKRRIQASSAPWQIVFFHHPPFSSGEHGSTTVMRWPFERWGVDAVLNGHDHNYERIIRDDNDDGKEIPYIISGLGGRSKDPLPRDVAGSVFKYSDEFGALFITATDNQLKFEFRNILGVVVDTYTVSK